MSTFGKKSLAWWNYHDHSRDNVRRYNLTSKEMQIEILKKWYPLGFKLKEFSFTNRTWEVIGYLETLTGWYLELKSDDHYKTQKNPLSMSPLKESEVELKREIKLEKILK